MRLQIQKEKWQLYPSKYGGEMYISPEEDSVVCFHSTIQYNPKHSLWHAWECIDCGDCSLEKHEFPHFFTSYAPDFFEPVKRLYGEQTTVHQNLE